MSHRRRRKPLETLAAGPGWVVVDKPSGLLAAPGRSDHIPSAVTELHAALQAKDPEAERPRVCHRISSGESGCLLLATDLETSRTLTEAVRDGSVERVYLALVTGAPHPRDGEVQLRVVPDRLRPGVVRLSERKGRLAHLRYETVDNFRGLSLLRVAPVTWATHDIRIGLRQVGTPCAIDPEYGGRDPILLSKWKPNYKLGRDRASERPLIARLTLHLQSLTFTPPGGDAPITVESPLPKDLRGTLNQLRRHARPGTL